MKTNLNRSLRVLGSLFLLLILTTLLAFLHLGTWSWILALVISFAMSGLILLFFMKVRYSEPLIWITSVAGFVWLSLFLTFVLLDYLSRPWPG